MARRRRPQRGQQLRAVSLAGLEGFDPKGCCAKRRNCDTTRFRRKSYTHVHDEENCFGGSHGATPRSTAGPAVTTLEDIQPIARRVLGDAHPLVVDNERELRSARAKLRYHEARGA